MNDAMYIIQIRQARNYGKRDLAKDIFWYWTDFLVDIVKRPAYLWAKPVCQTLTHTADFNKKKLTLYPCTPCTCRYADLANMLRRMKRCAPNSAGRR